MSQVNLSSNNPFLAADEELMDPAKMVEECFKTVKAVLLKDYKLNVPKDLKFTGKDWGSITYIEWGPSNKVFLKDGMNTRLEVWYSFQDQKTGYSFNRDGKYNGLAIGISASITALKLGGGKDHINFSKYFIFGLDPKKVEKEIWIGTEEALHTVV